MERSEIVKKDLQSYRVDKSLNPDSFIEDKYEVGNRVYRHPLYGTGDFSWALVLGVRVLRF